MINMPDVLVVGLTGMSGAGKTTVCDAFAERGFEIINADTVAREVVKKGGKCLEEIQRYFNRFSENVVLENGEMNRKKVAEIIFSDNNKKIEYNNIIYPYISYKILNKIYDLHANGAEYILIDAPTLFESKADDLCRVVISVVSDKCKCIERIIQRDSVTAEMAEKRLDSQFCGEYYMEKSEYCLVNNSTEDELRLKAGEIISKIRSGNDKKRKTQGA